MSQIQLPLLFQNHMMLQRDKPLHICGQAAEGCQISIVLNDIRVTVPIENHAFSCTFPAQPAGTHKTLSFYVHLLSENNDSDVIFDALTPDLTLCDISIGDIWLACGQSNMEFFLRYDAHWNDIRKLSRNENIHMFNVPQIAYEGQERYLPDSGIWFLEHDPAFAAFSAAGYAFARALQPILNIPIGIIGCNWGGTPACAWIEESYLSKEPLSIFNREYEAALREMPPEDLQKKSMEALEFEDSYHHQLEWRAMMYGLTRQEQEQWIKEHEGDPVLPMGPYHHYRPSGLFHTMIEKIAPFSVKGILWYQGESDSDHAALYDKTLTALIQCFRDVFRDSDLPFLLAQLAPFGKWLDCTGAHYEIVREKQAEVARHVDNTAMICLMDLGMYEDIHPKFKKEVGERFALLARGRVYGESLLCESPEITHVRISKDSSILTLMAENTGASLHGAGTLSGGFSLLLDEKPLEMKDCTLLGNQIQITLLFQSAFTSACAAPDGHILSVSYAYTPYYEGNIWNEAQLPLKPFHAEFSLSSVLQDN